MLAVDWRGRSVPRSTAISTRLLNETHRRLMRGVRGANKQPGEIRHSQNWIGGTRPGNAVFVPAPPEELPALLTSFEKYLHAENGLPPLVRIGLAHVQFETIHPYLDGNGAHRSAAHYTAARALEAPVRATALSESVLQAPSSCVLPAAW